MRLAVLSDIHGNLTALEAVLADLQKAGGADVTWCLGDLAAFGSRPAECIHRIQELAQVADEGTFRVIGGNTDRYLVTGERLHTPPAPDQETFKKLANEWGSRDMALNWAVSRLSYEDYTYLQGLLGKELSLDVDGFGRVIGYHAAPGSDEVFLTPETPDDQVLDALLDREGRLAIGGHTHRQMNRVLGQWRVVNVGSVGMSFDAPGKAQWGLFTFNKRKVKVTLRAVPYDVNKAVADLHTVGYPVVEWTARKLRPGS